MNAIGYLLLGDGTGNFPTGYSLFFGPGMDFIDLRDFNGDGKQDVILSALLTASASPGLVTAPASAKLFRPRTNCGALNSDVQVPRLWTGEFNRALSSIIGSQLTGPSPSGTLRSGSGGASVKRGVRFAGTASAVRPRCAPSHPRASTPCSVRDYFV